MTSGSLKIIIANYQDREHCNNIVALLDNYARDPMGGNKPLSEYAKNNLCTALKHIEGAFSLLAYWEKQAIGVANCFMGFSTFQCAPLVNIHDIAVLNDYRRRGVGQQLLLEIEKIARQRNCCKLTLEVLASNTPAQRSYQKQGFKAYTLTPETGCALFWEKNLLP